MFTDAIKLGIRDIFKYRRIFYLLVILILATSIMIISVIISISSSVEADITTSITYSAIPISYDTKSSDSISNSLNEIFAQGGYSYFSSDYLNEKFKSNIIVLLGQYEKNSNNTVIWCVPKSKLDIFHNELDLILRISPDSIDEKKLDLLSVKNIVNNSNIALIKSDSMQFKKLNYYRLMDVELISLIENTKFSNLDIENNLDIKFEKIFLNTFLCLNKNIFSNEDEVDFMIYYMFIYIFLLIMSISISFVIFIRYLYKKMHKEYKIHLICGADKISIFIRNSVFVFFLIAFNFLLINYLNDFSFNIIFIINIIVSVLFAVVLLSIILRMLIKENLIMSL